MATNSIIANLDKVSVISEISLTLSADFKQIKTVIIVEGYDDIDCLAKFIDKNSTIVESYSGKEGVYDIASYFSADSRVIGICDKDYESLPKFNNVMFYDFSCLEMMLISDEDFFNIYTACIYQGKDSPKKLLYKILSQIHPLGFLREYSYKNQLGIIFSDNKCIQQIIKKSNCSIGDLICVLNENPSNSGKLNLKILESLYKPTEILIDYLNLCNGHDFLQILHKEINEHTKRKGHRSKETISSNLFSLYSFDYFKKTNIFSAIQDYQLSNNLTILVS